MKKLTFLLLIAAPVLAFPQDNFLNAAKQQYGEAGAKAAEFLMANMPEQDRVALDHTFLMENLELALKARTTFPWAKQVPEELFLNDVLPYAVFDESRDPWRADFFEKVSILVEGSATATEAAQRINRDFFNMVNVHYSTDRERPNQSPSESIASGKASCTGLSILLVDACRAAGIPARAVGTPQWSNKRGNHTWVEIWDNGWHFMGADEYAEEGVDHGWFVADAAAAQEDVPEHAIYATSWEKTGLNFPMVWAAEQQEVAAVNVTDRYAKPSQPSSPELGIRLYSPEGQRISKQGALTTTNGVVLDVFEAKGETADMNDLPRLLVTPGTAYRIRFGFYETAVFTAAEGIRDMDIHPGDLHPVKTLQKAQVSAEIDRTFEQLVDASRNGRKNELDARAIELNGKTLRWKERSFGKAPAQGRSLWISMHGGGNTSSELNDRQWANQAGLYQPEEGIYIAPRAPTDTWNLWHEEHIDPLFQRLIEDYVALRSVDPNRIYLMGYSAGGDGVWQLAPRMADRFAAAAMMAGHPNESSVLGLRNLPFALFVGKDDNAYNRSTVVAEKADELDSLHEEDRNGYIHMSRIYPDTGHWMNGNDREALPWMDDFDRNPWPKKIVWLQDDVTHDRFYWLKLPEGSARKGQKIVATVAGQDIVLEGDIPAGLRIRLSDQLIDLDQPVSVTVNGTERFAARVPREAGVIEATLAERLDPSAAACAEIVIQ